MQTRRRKQMRPIIFLRGILDGMQPAHPPEETNAVQPELLAQLKKELEPVADPSKMVDEDPSETVDNNPSKMVDEDPSKMVDEDPSETVDNNPSKMVDNNPSKMVDEDPSETVDEDPTKIVDEDPSKMVDEDPTKIVDEDPSEEVEEINELVVAVERTVSPILLDKQTKHPMAPPAHACKTLRIRLQKNKTLKKLNFQT
jgi:hypothetical protein